jgi:hypothetical protein
MPGRIVIPDDYRAILPIASAITALKATPPTIIAAHSRLYRAAWNAASILPMVPNRFYRFGPPAAVLTPSAPPPYWSLYVADQAMTGIYEAQFCGHAASTRGHFYVEAAAETGGLLATMDLPSDLRLLNLTGDTAFQLGIFDALSGEDHLWCQWLAWQLVNAGFFRGKNRFDGVLYPSPKNRGETAIALFSAHVETLRPRIKYSTVPFVSTPEYRQLLASPLWMARRMPAR